MGYTIVRFQETPNPNAVKCILDRPLADPIRSFRHAGDAAADPLAAALFRLPGVTSVLLSGGWLTVNKGPSTPWPDLKAGIQRVLKDATDQPVAPRAPATPTPQTQATETPSPAS